ncbi:hypothetical protein GVAV_001993 [Gurleya vavrai]
MNIQKNKYQKMVIEERILREKHINNEIIVLIYSKNENKNDIRQIIKNIFDSYYGCVKNTKNFKLFKQFHNERLLLQDYESDIYTIFNNLYQNYKNKNSTVPIEIIIKEAGTTVFLDDIGEPVNYIDRIFYEENFFSFDNFLETEEDFTIIASAISNFERIVSLNFHNSNCVILNLHFDKPNTEWKKNDLEYFFTHCTNYENFLPVTCLFKFNVNDYFKICNENLPLINNSLIQMKNGKLENVEYPFTTLRDNAGNKNIFFNNCLASTEILIKDFLKLDNRFNCYNISAINEKYLGTIEIQFKIFETLEKFFLNFYRDEKILKIYFKVTEEFEKYFINFFKESKDDGINNVVVAINSFTKVVDFDFFCSIFDDITSLKLSNIKRMINEKLINTGLQK